MFRKNSKNKKNNSNKKFKSDKLYLISKIILTTFFSFTVFLDNDLVFQQKLRATAFEVYFSKIGLNDVLAFFVSWILTFLFIKMVELIVTKLEPYFYNKERVIRKKYFWIIFAIIFVTWLPYLLTYFPGGIFSDTQDSIKQCLHMKPYNNLNPILYTLMIKVFLIIGNIFGNYQLGIELFTIFQFVSMIAVLSYFIYWLYKRKVSNSILLVLVLFFCFFKLFPLYAISLWKDTPFCIALFLFIIFTSDIILSNGNKLKNKKIVIIYVFMSIIISFLRNNGRFVLLVFSLVLIIIYRKKQIRLFIVSSLLTFIVIFVIQGPIFNRLALNDTSGIVQPIILDQIFYVKVVDGKINKKQDKIINNMYLNKDKLKEVYAPFLFYATSVTPEFNKYYVVHNEKKIKKLWFELLIQNPDLYIESYLLNTLGFWDANRQFTDAYISDFMWPETDQIIDIEQNDVIKNVTHTSIKEIIKANRIYSSALFLFILLFSSLITIYNKRYINLLIYLPSIFIWGTIMLATPIAFSLRYVYILVLMTPYCMVIPFLKSDEETEK